MSMGEAERERDILSGLSVRALILSSFLHWKMLAIAEMLCLEEASFDMSAASIWPNRANEYKNRRRIHVDFMICITMLLFLFILFKRLLTSSFESFDVVKWPNPTKFFLVVVFFLSIFASFVYSLNLIIHVWFDKNDNDFTVKARKLVVYSNLAWFDGL